MRFFYPIFLPPLLMNENWKRAWKVANVHMWGDYLDRLLYSRRWIDACRHDYAESGLG